MTYSYDEANQLEWLHRAAPELTRATYSYDANGNLHVMNAMGDRTTYSWDAENRVTQVRPPGGADINTMSYFGDGKRRAYVDSVMVRTFLWDGENIARQTLMEYTHNPQGYGELISANPPGESSRFHHYDALGSTMQMTDGDGAVVNWYIYRAFGEVAAESETFANRFRWVGRLGYYRQPDLGNYWLRARIYDPQRGRFVSRDPVRQANSYIWPGNSPVVIFDPSGMQGWRRRRGAEGPRRYGRRRFHRPTGTGVSELTPQVSQPAEAASGACPGSAPAPPEGFYPYPPWPCGSSGGSWTCTRPGTGEKCGICDFGPYHYFLGCECVDWSQQQHVGGACCRGAFHAKAGAPPRWQWDPIVWKFGACLTEKNVCGPEIYAQLAATVRKIRRVYYAASVAARNAACNNLTNINPLAGVPAVDAWDIIELRGDSGAPDILGLCPKGDECRETVQVAGNCFPSGGVNYVAGGVMASLCGISGFAWFSLVSLWTVGHLTDTAYRVTATLWANAGHEGWPAYATPPETKPRCRDCPEALSDRRDFSVHWTGMQPQDF